MLRADPEVGDETIEKIGSGKVIGLGVARPLGPREPHVHCLSRIAFPNGSKREMNSKLDAVA